MRQSLSLVFKKLPSGQPIALLDTYPVAWYGLSMKLKIDLQRYETLVFGKVLEQSFRDRHPIVYASRGKDEDETHFGEFSIRGASKPHILEKCLFVRGGESFYDNSVFYKNFDSVEEAKEFCENIMILLSELNKNL